MYWNTSTSACRNTVKLVQSRNCPMHSQCNAQYDNQTEACEQGVGYLNQTTSAGHVRQYTHVYIYIYIYMKCISIGAWPVHFPKSESRLLEKLNKTLSPLTISLWVEERSHDARNAGSKSVQKPLG